jgi:hypothetical protein
MQARGDADREMGFAGTSAADQHEIALVSQEAAASEVVHQRLVDGRAVEDELVDLLGEGQLGDGDLVLDRTRLLLGDLGREQVADDPLRLVLPLHRGRDDLVIGCLHAEEFQSAHGGQDLGSLHHPLALLRLSSYQPTVSLTHAGDSQGSCAVIHRRKQARVSMAAAIGLRGDVTR